jgi:hypothetical protein
VIFAPLYGGAALIIREASRRAGRGWPTMLLLGLAFGVLQAGLLDHSMFNPSYRDIEYWDEMFAPTHVPALGLSVNLVLMFTVGHLIWSIAAPIAIVEALVPGRRTTPWLGWPGLSIVAAGFGLAAWFVLWWHLDTEEFLPTGWQLAGAAAVVVALTVAAFPIRRRPSGLARPSRPAGDRPAAGPWLVGGVAFGLLVLPTVVELALEQVGGDPGGWPQRAAASWFLTGWAGLAWNVALLAGLALLVVRWSGRAGWGPVHQLALAGGALLANVVTAFAAEPIGEVSTAAKLTHNTVALLGVVALLTVAAHRLRRADRQQASVTPARR